MTTPPTAPGPPKDPRHRRFAQLYLEGNSIVESYLKAGFDCPRRSAKVCASRLLRRPDVAEFLAASRAASSMILLQSPESAPKDGTMILAAIGWPWLVPAVWDGESEQWAVVTVQAGTLANGKVNRWWETDTEAPQHLQGWLPWPEMPGGYVLRHHSQTER